MSASSKKFIEALAKRSQVFYISSHASAVRGACASWAQAGRGRGRSRGCRTPIGRQVQVVVALYPTHPGVPAPGSHGAARHRAGTAGEEQRAALLAGHEADLKTRVREGRTDRLASRQATLLRSRMTGPPLPRHTSRLSDAGGLERMRVVGRVNLSLSYGTRCIPALPTTCVTSGGRPSAFRAARVCGWVNLSR